MKNNNGVLSTCTLCHSQYRIRGFYDSNNDYHESEDNHIPGCLFYGIDPLNRPYVKQEEIDNWKPKKIVEPEFIWTNEDEAKRNEYLSDEFLRKHGWHK